MDSNCIKPEYKNRPLYDKWVLWVHLPHDTNWSLKSYKKIMEINTLEEIVELYNIIPEIMVLNCMLFLMRAGINPRWEDPKNKTGGCYSYKILNENTFDIWKQMSFKIVGETLSKEKQHSLLINGITLSPKKSFHILKIWMINCENQNSNIFTDIDNLDTKGCLFKRHR